MSQATTEPTVLGELDIQISDADIQDAMTRIPGYLDISVEDFQEVYRLAFAHAMERMLQDSSAEQIMLPTITALGPGDSLELAANRMAKESASLAVVVDTAGKVIGVVTESDFLGVLDSEGLMGLLAGELQRTADLRERLARLRCADIMSAPAITIHRRASARQMLQTFKTSHR